MTEHLDKINKAQWVITAAAAVLAAYLLRRTIKGTLGRAASLVIVGYFTYAILEVIKQAMIRRAVSAEVQGALGSLRQMFGAGDSDAPAPPAADIKPEERKPGVDVTAAKDAARRAAEAAAAAAAAATAAAGGAGAGAAAITGTANIPGRNLTGLSTPGINPSAKAPLV